VTGGGGFDAFPMMQRSLAALEHLRVAPHHMVLVAGPLMPHDDHAELRRLASSTDKAEVWRQADNPLEVLAAADVVVSMCGYNTVTEAIALGRRVLVMPRRRVSGLEAVRALQRDDVANDSEERVNPSEQVLRARAFAERGLVEIIADDAGPHAIAAAIDVALSSPAQPPAGLQLDGLANVTRLIYELIDPDRRSRELGPEPARAV
jgi:predicted glycosyltransferase